MPSEKPGPCASQKRRTGRNVKSGSHTCAHTCVHGDLVRKPLLIFKHVQVTCAPEIHPGVLLFLAGCRCPAFLGFLSVICDIVVRFWAFSLCGNQTHTQVQEQPTEIPAPRTRLPSGDLAELRAASPPEPGPDVTRTLLRRHAFYVCTLSSVPLHRTCRFLSPPPWSRCRTSVPCGTF